MDSTSVERSFFRTPLPGADGGQELLPRRDPHGVLDHGARRQHLVPRHALLRAALALCQGLATAFRFQLYVSVLVGGYLQWRADTCTSQISRVPQMAVNGAQICDLESIDGQICHTMV
jgi:hypothetical protein